MSKRILMVGVVLLVLVLVGAGAFWWLQSQRSDLAEVVGGLPAGTERATWTDWAGIRDELGSDVSAESTAGEVLDFLDAGFEADLTSTSALVSSAETLQEKFGFSPATVEWELFAQSEAGAVIEMGTPESLSLDTVADNLEALGYTRPEEDDGVWVGGPDLLGTLGGNLTPELAFVAIDRDDHRILTSDTADYLDTAMQASNGDRDGLDGVDDVMSVTEAAGEPLSAAVYTGDYACGALAMSQAGDTDQAEAEQLLADAGEVNAFTAMAMAAQRNGDVRVVMSFEDDHQARTNADTRATLARGPAPGQGGDFSDRFSVRSVTADGSLVTMDLNPAEGEYVLSDLSSGPVLFATC